MNDKTVLLKGLAASSGEATGIVRLVFGQADIGKMSEGNILVTPLTNPQLMIAILKASAIVTEIGGTLSHAAIVSREFGIPCVVGAKDATKILKDGMEVTVNGTKGTIHGKSS